MSSDLEDRLRGYGSTLDAATANDLADRRRVGDVRSRLPGRRARWFAASAAILTLASITAVGASGRAHLPGSEEGPPITKDRAAQLAKWRSEYDQTEVAYVIEQGGGAPRPDQEVVSVMEFRTACRVTRSAVQAATNAPADERAAVVDRVMQPELARLAERNLPPPDESAQMFRTLADDLKRGDAGTVLDWLEGPRGSCKGAFAYRP